MNTIILNKVFGFVKSREWRNTLYYFQPKIYKMTDININPCNIKIAHLKPNADMAERDSYYNPFFVIRLFFYYAIRTTYYIFCVIRFVCKWFCKRHPIFHPFIWRISTYRPKYTSNVFVSRLGMVLLQHLHTCDRIIWSRLQPVLHTRCNPYAVYAYCNQSLFMSSWVCWYSVFMFSGWFSSIL